MLIGLFSTQMSPLFLTRRLIGGLELFPATVAVGRFILSDWSRIMLRLASMKDASRKNMMSMSGMISIRAFLCGHGEPILIYDLSFLPDGIPPYQIPSAWPPAP